MELDIKPVIIGLTGQTGAGKSMVGRYLESLGYRVIDADIISRRVVEKGGKCLAELVDWFGGQILLPDGSLDRRRLGDIIFSDENMRGRLGEIIFPYIRADIGREVERLSAEGARVIFLDAPTLFESGEQKSCDFVLSVIARPKTRLERIMARDKLTRERAERRMTAQHGDEYYTSRSDFVIVNNGDLDTLYARVDEVLAGINAAEGERI